ncbi:alpha/beta hydrolase family protein [Streptomyces sp. 1114.5]|uniref:alpha/beta hydrolase n=1 Tax=Streptomyces sp. 1114.5 TaxID=1938830 RepID=UPI000EB46FE3|nr:alpha/beta hydrolase [Streptomyces sp. 1114.5]RKT18204.1 alpha/beta hydrolase family protein [Streptomyces sp. 1114.5]
MSLYELLVKFDPHGLHDAAKAWTALGHTAESIGQRHRSQVNGPLAGNWEGDDAKAALSYMAKTEQQLNIVKMEADTAALVLNTVADRIYQAQTNLTNAVKRSVDAGLNVSADGVVSIPPVGKGEANDPDAIKARQQLASEMQGFQSRIDTALKEAQTASDQGNKALGQLSSNALDPTKVNGALTGAKNAAAAAMQDLGLVDPYIPDGKDPEKSAAWWKGLTPEQQEAYLALHPDQIGKLDGLPTTVRDEANRLVLDEKLDAYRSGKPGDFGIDEDEYKSRINALEEIKRKLTASDGNPEKHQMFLLGIDPEAHNGRAIVSTGNPDKAQHTAVFVPGTGTVFAGVPGQMDHIRRLQKAAEDKAGDENVAVVSWLGYETPNWLDGSVAQSDRGDAGAPLLRNFTKGLRVAEGDNGVCSHLTLMGHSYGSYVVGVAARDAGGANANDILALGSPGMGVEGAWQLNVDPKHVWVGTAKDDFIQTFTGTVLGDGPQYRDFDAQRIQIDTSGHGGYWDFGPGGASESLQNQGRIIAGRPPTLAPRYPR